ncbi:hypothetical protein EVB32_204 [Rhizobium phage RHph_TM39]|uniref:Uncharacterized protein n=2 Tax=Cuauhnahuacvirus TaxID=3044696 RepID=A0A7S5UYW6_9CAUD|nr:hypothetical protein PQC16_gp215 [Rhizobium phage RHph_TM30]YP_010671364.1 hypothetical protein PQC17_gp215 [Rhizobium phage RHph_Y65]QIG71685.1 hypothetical protein EVB94_214 [Rhizobium phage RHph_TM40]QIG72048.1 hypothetical protein EVB95_214 [Rhizobium phage RHph_TM2_3B]QIG72411.1 hypothetical protein EVB96_215 [Rhizobium phage RHph_TM3_3_6]QIG77192.1 hypothetical protein EVB32_204 [Rhizobium phage RHph_TM39]QIG77801.1 hypothetical protein EVB64_214 [Rhizobium phage RHph_TM61]
MRKTLTDIPIPAERRCATLKVVTKVPTKYILIDSETGHVYRGNSSHDQEIHGYDWRSHKVDRDLVQKVISEVIKEEENVL